MYCINSLLLLRYILSSRAVCVQLMIIWCILTTWWYRPAPLTEWGYRLAYKLTSCFFYFKIYFVPLFLNCFILLSLQVFSQNCFKICCASHFGASWLVHFYFCQENKNEYILCGNSLDYSVLEIHPNFCSRCVTTKVQTAIVRSRASCN